MRRVAMRRILSATILCGAAAVLTGCSGAQVKVESEFPVPLTNRLPVSMGLYLDDALTSYKHEEEFASGSDWAIDLGPAQVQMFENLAQGMFSDYQMVSSVDAQNGVAGVLKPSIGDLQFTTPKQTRSDYFEVWIRYEFELFDNNGASLGNWDMTAYGKAHEQNHGTTAALQRAALNACRDAMAFFTLQFRTEAVVRNWLASQSGRGV